jgi:hypothetical protein
MLPLAPYVFGLLGLGSSPYLGAISGPSPGLAGKGQPREVRAGGSGTAITAGFIQDIEHNRDLTGTNWYGTLGQIGVAGKMMRDSHVRQSVNYVTDPLRAGTWKFKPASKSDLHVEQAAYCDWAFIERLPWTNILKRIVSDYSVDGFSLSEMTDGFVDVPVERFPLHPGRGRGIVPTGLHEIPGSTVHRFHPNPENSLQLERIQQWQPFNDAEQVGFREIEGNRIVRLTFDQKGGDFSGFALLRSAYAAWKCKLAFMAIDAIRHERRGVGTPIIILGEEVGDEDIEAAERTLEQMRTNAKGYAIFPNGWQFSWDTGNRGTGTDVNEAIARCDIAIAHNVSAGFMLLGLTGGSGSYGLSFTQKSQYHLSSVGHAAMVGAGFTLGCDGWSPVGRILELNYSEVGELPKLEARNLPTRDWAEVLPQLINATNAGLITPDDKLEDELRDIFQLGAHDPDTARNNPGGRPVGGIGAAIEAAVERAVERAMIARAEKLEEAA